MRLIGWILVLAGTWSTWKALAGDEPLGTGGILMLVLGGALLTARGQALARWIGEGVVTGLCLTGGLVLLALGVVMLLGYFEVLAEGIRLPVRSLALPAVFLGCGGLLVVVGARRLWRLRGLPE